MCIRDSYITNMGRPDIARIKRDADVATAEADRDTAIRRAVASRESAVAKALADQERVLAETLSQAKQAEAQRDLDVKKAEYLDVYKRQAVEGFGNARAQVDGVADQPLVAGLQRFHERFAAIGAAIVDLSLIHIW